MKNTIIIEFNGLPGSGKTTISKELKKILESNGYSVVTNYFRFYWNRFPFKILTIPYSLKLYTLARDYSRSILPMRKRTHLHKIVYWFRMYKQIIKYSSADFALIDQAFIQDLVSIAWLDAIPHSNKCDAIVKFLKEEEINFIRVDCANNMELSVNRIKERPQIGHLFESIDDVELYGILKIQSHNFDYVRETFSQILKNQYIIKIDTKLSPQLNAQIIKDFITDNRI